MLKKCLTHLSILSSVLIISIYSTKANPLPINTIHKMTLSHIKNDKLLDSKGHYIGFKRDKHRDYKKTKLSKALGLASYYNYPFHGRKTANGEIFNTNQFTAASPYLPLPCIVKVTNIDTLKVIYVRVNDRGPYINHQEFHPKHKRRVIDLSEAAMKYLEPNYKTKGLINVSVELDDIRTKVLREFLHV